MLPAPHTHTETHKQCVDRPRVSPSYCTYRAIHTYTQSSCKACLCQMQASKILLFSIISALACMRLQIGMCIVRVYARASVLVCARILEIWHHAPAFMWCVSVWLSVFPPTLGSSAVIDNRRKGEGSADKEAKCADQSMQLTKGKESGMKGGRGEARYAGKRPAQINQLVLLTSVPLFFLPSLFPPRFERPVHH